MSKSTAQLEANGKSAASSNTSLQLGAFFPMFCWQDTWLPHIFLSLCRNWGSERLQTKIIVPNASKQFQGADLIQAVPSSMRWLVYRHAAWPRIWAERRLLQVLPQLDAIYSFPDIPDISDISLKTLRRIKRRGRPIFLERINCFSGKAKRILEPEYKQLGAAPQVPFANWQVEQEHAALELADFLFSPSPEVESSLLEIGVPKEKIIVTSYGWAPRKFPDAGTPRSPRERVKILFLGHICVRKGVHLLLNAWARAGIAGQLILCGAIEPALARLVHDALRRQDVLHVPPTFETGPIYQDADVFAFPSLEEGGPLVMYEAMAHGLAVVTSPMGAGAVLRSGVDGVVLPPHDTDAWVETLRKFARSPELRERFGKAARERAAEFTWDKVAKRRADVMLQKLGRV